MKQDSELWGGESQSLEVDRGAMKRDWGNEAQIPAISSQPTIEAAVPATKAPKKKKVVKKGAKKTVAAAADDGGALSF